MQRALDRLSREQFDLLIVGGGATGCFTARDAALRGLKVALIEARDFAAATSAHNSKLAHGGLRYLRNLELGLVRESLRERRALLTIAPHLVRPLPFLFPLYGGGIANREYVRAGLTLYDMLSFDRNWGHAQPMPGHRWLDRRAALAREPVIDAPGLQGAFEYHDAQMYTPERIALECLVDADAHGAAIANHVAATGLLLRDGKVEGAAARDAMTGAVFDIRARAVLIAAGPWSDLFIAQATARPALHRLVRSKGIHLLLPPMTNGAALTVEAGAGHFFVMPWRGRTLLGTTDTAFDGDPGSVGVEESDIDGLLALTNRHLPAAHLARADVRFFYAGLRPLVDSGQSGTYGVSRKAALVDHGAAEGLDGVFSALGGKWTTSRALAQSVTDAVMAKLGRTAMACVTAREKLPGGRFDELEPLIRGMEKTYPGIAALRHMAHMFGARLPLVLQGAKVVDLVPLGDSGDTPAQVAFAVRHEMALTLEDVVMRRTCLGQFGPLPAGTLQRVAAIMAPLLGWNDGETARQVESLAPLYRTQG